MENDYSKLKGRIVEVFGNQYNFAIAMKISEKTISLKLTGKSPWNQKEIFRAAHLLGIVIDDVGEYFFKEKVRKIRQNQSKEAS